MRDSVGVRRSELAALCGRYGVARLALFGRGVDLVEIQTVRNPCLRREIEGTGVGV